MKYTVVWNKQPTESIDAAWDEATSEGRDRLYKATEAIHESLSANPFAAGESRDYAIDRVIIASSADGLLPNRPSDFAGSRLRRGCLANALI